MPRMTAEHQLTPQRIARRVAVGVAADTAGFLDHEHAGGNVPRMAAPGWHG